MLEVLKGEPAVPPSNQIAFVADALGDADLALAGLRSPWDGRRPEYFYYWQLWIKPYSQLRTLPGFKELMRETGLADYWRQTGDWGDVCRPKGTDGFECS